ncbi:MAG: SpoIIIAH-like family protein [Oscillospiraceae bacterium]|nr:SpoIIIAH-like family protein [Oscillospiraceae bacterium]
MKTWKKNLVAAAVLVTVCTGIYLNWLYAEQSTAADLTDMLDAEKVMNDDTLVFAGEAEILAGGEQAITTASDYFAAVRLSRQEARDSAVNLLQEAMAYSDQTKAEESSVQLEEIVQTALSEAQIESLVIAKGYTDCVAYMTNEGISVAVASPEGGLQEADVAVIADIVMSQSDYTMRDIRVVEVQ